MAGPHPVSPEWKVIEYALVRMYLTMEQLEEAQAKVAGSQEDGALLRLLVTKYFSRAHVAELRTHYEEQKEVFLREAEEAAIEVMSISDILVRPPLEVEPKSGRFRTVPIEEALMGSSDETRVPKLAARQTASKWQVASLPREPAPIPTPQRRVSAPLASLEPIEVPVPDYDEPIVLDTSPEPATPKAGKAKKKVSRRSGRAAEARDTGTPARTPWLLVAIAIAVPAALAIVLYLVSK